MEKSKFEALEAIEKKMETGTATFAERNYFKINWKVKLKKERTKSNRSLGQVATRSTSRFRN